MSCVSSLTLVIDYRRSSVFFLFFSVLVCGRSYDVLHLQLVMALEMNGWSACSDFSQEVLIV